VTRRALRPERPCPLLPPERHHTTLTAEIDGTTYEIRAWLTDYGLDFDTTPAIATNHPAYDALERVARRAVIATAEAADAKRRAS
jgi:hypothetical protein